METHDLSEDGYISRFAHPFFTPTPLDNRMLSVDGATRMLEYIAKKLQPLPQYNRNAKLIMTLKDIVGTRSAEEIAVAGIMSFHLGGDPGAPVHGMQQPIADIMTEDYDVHDHLKSPAFFLHLGDVIYYENTTEGYHKQFYEPYKKYPGKIIAIPGNHDGEMFKYNEKNQPSTGQKFSLAAFIDNFCRPRAEVPEAATTIYRQMVAQPGVYWWLKTDLIDIIGLYSNVSEGPGYLVTRDDFSQKNWLQKTLKTVAAERKQTDNSHKALLIAVHHPPFSAAGHRSSREMLHDIDECCIAAGILPDAFVSGHSHNYQHFERNVKCSNRRISVPYLIVGDSGHNADAVVSKKLLDSSIPKNVTVGKSLDGNGYILAKVTRQKLSFEFYEVKVDSNNKITKKLFDKCSVTLKSSNLGKLRL